MATPDLAAPDGLRNLPVTVMGLGQHGGGVATARYLHRHGARVTITDLQPEAALTESLRRLPAGIRRVLGRHDQADFASAAVVVKNPGVPPDSEHLARARARGVPIENDISLFARRHRNVRVVAVTGSKGKSTTASAIHAALVAHEPGTALGGNITVSPLAFADQLPAGATVVLELSSFQLGDLPSPSPLHPEVAVVTAVLADHQDRYPDMATYMADKARLLEDFVGQATATTPEADMRPPCVILTSSARRWLTAPDGARSYEVAATATADTARDTWVGAWVDARTRRVWVRTSPGEEAIVLVERPTLQGAHNLLNIGAAGLAVLAWGLPPAAARRSLAAFAGIEHRMELVRELEGIRYINDSAATVPEATAAALATVERPVTLLAGGSAKGLAFDGLAAIDPAGVRAVLLAGSATAALQAALEQAGVPCAGPYDTLEAALDAAVGGATAAGRASAGETVLFSPGCTSFGMFANEFDRGRRFKSAVARLAATASVSD